MTPPKSPEQKARERIDADLLEAGWKVQDRDDINLTAGRGVAVCMAHVSGRQVLGLDGICARS
jgi:type I site-specific restriction endonuclease